jgi:subtilisin family serine protease
MKKVLRFLFIFIFFTSFYISITNSEVNKIDEKVLEEIQEKDDVRVIIKLEEKSSYQKILNVDTKQQIIDSLNNKVKHDFNNSVSAIIFEEDLVNLENNLNVKSIELVGIKQIFLQDSVPLINATPTWDLQINNVNLTGLDETVCIIDTGINYSHSDFGNCYGENNVSSSCKVIGGWDYCADDVNCTMVDSDPMDVHGHGTHVAGIVGANGSIKGVAPDIKIVMIKASNSTGTFWEDDLIKAVDWCVNNASAFNISVISMSLGGGLYDSYCNADLLASSVNNAIANNISVVVATGNDAKSTHIASPACIQNSTAIGSTTKSDSISSFSNRNNLTDLFAPGSDINSTIISGGYSGNTWSGTSMATPHVAGVFALIRQFKKLETGQILTPQNIENYLKNTGKQVNDSGNSNLNFSRIDVYSAILSIDETAPNVVLISPNNDSLLSPQNLTFKCNATDELQLSNLTMRIWNSTSLYYENTTQALGNFLEVEFNFSLIEDNYNWNCFSLDNKSNSASGNFSLTINEKFVTLSSPSNNSYTNVNDTNFTCNSQTDSVLQLANSTFYLWNSTGNLTYNETKNISGNSNETIFNFTLTNEISYLWNCLSYDNGSELIFADANFTLIYDITNPNITLVSPADGDSSLTGTNNVDFEYNVSEENLANCSLIINDIEDQTNNSINISITNEFTKSLSVGSYDWKINCVDFAGNIQNSSARTLIINSPPSTSTSGSGGGGGGGSSSVGIISSTYKIDQEQIEQGVSKNLKINDKLKFNVQNEEHGLIINKLSSNELTLTISSDPITLILKIGETKKVNLNNNEYYDLEVILNSIKNSRANISIESINEKIPVRNIFNQGNEVNQSVIELENISEGNGFITGFVAGDITFNKQTIVGSIISVFVVLIIYFLIRFKKYFSKFKSKVKRKKSKKMK